MMNKLASDCGCSDGGGSETDHASGVEIVRHLTPRTDNLRNCGYCSENSLSSRDADGEMPSWVESWISEMSAVSGSV